MVAGQLVFGRTGEVELELEDPDFSLVDAFAMADQVTTGLALEAVELGEESLQVWRRVLAHWRLDLLLVAHFAFGLDLRISIYRTRTRRVAL